MSHTMLHTHNYYAWKPGHMTHLSAGAIIKNDEDEILVHKLDRIGGKYFLPKKTMLPYGSLEQAVHATTLETGWQLEIVTYVGSLQSSFPAPKSSAGTGEFISKTTLYFLCTPLREIGRDPNDRDADSELHWVDLTDLIKIFQEQGKNPKDNDLDQSEILMGLV